MTSYSERLWPTPWLYVACLLFLPAVTLMLTPLSLTLGIVSALVVYGAACWFLIGTSPRITLDAERLTAGRASIERRHLGEAVALSGDELTLAIGPNLDARAHLLLRGWIKSGVLVRLTDPSDPTPYWLISSRNPEALAAALNGGTSA